MEAEYAVAFSLETSDGSPCSGELQRCRFSPEAATRGGGLPLSIVVALFVGGKHTSEIMKEIIARQILD